MTELGLMTQLGRINDEGLMTEVGQVTYRDMIPISIRHFLMILRMKTFCVNWSCYLQERSHKMLMIANKEPQLNENLLIFSYSCVPLLLGARQELFLTEQLSDS